MLISFESLSPDFLSYEKMKLPLLLKLLVGIFVPYNQKHHSYYIYGGI